MPEPIKNDDMAEFLGIWGEAVSGIAFSAWEVSVESGPACPVCDDMFK